MNIVTKADVKKFLSLLKAGLREGQQKKMTTYSSVTLHDGTDVPKSYYISLEFSFHINPDAIEKIIGESNFDEEMGDLLNGIK